MLADEARRRRLRRSRLLRSVGLAEPAPRDCLLEVLRNEGGGFCAAVDDADEEKQLGHRQFRVRELGAQDGELCSLGDQLVLDGGEFAGAAGEGCRG